MENESDPLAPARGCMTAILITLAAAISIITLILLIGE